eukprot:g5078.t1
MNWTYYPSLASPAYNVAPMFYNQNNGATANPSQDLQRIGSASGLIGIQVKVDENYILPEPLNFTRFTFKEVSNSQFEFDYSIEKELLQNYRNKENGVDDQAEVNPAESYVVVDPWGETIRHFVQMGHSREAVCLALALFPNNQGEQVTSFLNKHEQLVSMGFESELVTKTLLYHNQDIQAATESCIASCTQ